MESNSSHLEAGGFKNEIFDSSVEPREVLEDFIKTPIGGAYADWEARLRHQVKQRLAGLQDRGYLHSIRQASANYDKAKARVLAALFTLELRNLDQVQDQLGYNKAVLLRLTIDMASRNGLLGEVMRHELSALPLAKISAGLSQAWRGNARPEEDAKRLVWAAVGRRQTAEKEDAERIFRTIAPTIAAKKFVLAVEDYPNEAIAFALEQMQQFEPSRVETAMKFIQDTLRQANVYEETKDDWSKRRRNLPWEQAQSEFADREKVARQASLINRALSVIPMLGVALEAYEHKQKLDEETKQQEEAERAERERLEVEAEAERIRSAQIAEQRTREEAARRSREEEMARLRAEVSEEVARWTEFLENAQCDGTAVDFDAIFKWDHMARFYLGHLSFNPNCRWPAIKKSGGFVGLWPLETEFDKFCERYASVLDENEKVRLRGLWKQTKERLILELEDLWNANQENIYANLLRCCHEGPEEWKEPRIRVQEALEEVEIKIRRITDNRDIDRREVPLLERVAAELRVECERLDEEAAQAEREQARENIEELKRQFLLDRTGEQLEYLLSLYEAGTGLGLANLKGRGNESSHSSIGSISIGHRLVQKIELKMTMELLPDEGIKLEMGDDYEATKKRARMVDWVGPHEIGHAVDWSGGSGARVADALTEQTQSVLDEFLSEEQEGVRSKLSFTLNECVIDGLGYRLLRDHGTSNPLHESVSERVQDAAEGFCAMLGAFQQAAAEREETDERAVDYLILSLRELAVGRELLHDVLTISGDARLAHRLEDGLREVEELISNMPETLAVIHQTQREAYMELCREYFLAARTVELA